MELSQDKPLPPSLPLLQCGEGIFNLHRTLCPDPFEKPLAVYPTKVLRARVKRDSLKVAGLVANDPAHEPIRRALGLRPEQPPDVSQLQVLAISAYADIGLHKDETPDSIARRVAPTLSSDILTGQMLGRRIMAVMLEQGILILSGHLIYPNGRVRLWLCGHPLCAPGLHETALKAYLAKASATPDQMGKPWFTRGAVGIGITARGVITLSGWN